LVRAGGRVSVWVHHAERLGKRPVGLSIFFPAYNDSGTIASLVITGTSGAERLTSDFEIIVVNDGSVDATRAIADELARTYPTYA